MNNLIPMNDHKVSARELRRRLNADSALLREQAAPVIGQLQHNELVTQRRIISAEARLVALEQTAQAWSVTWDAWARMTFWQRAMWLVRGTQALVPKTQTGLEPTETIGYFNTETAVSEPVSTSIATQGAETA